MYTYRCIFYLFVQMYTWYKLWTRVCCSLWCTLESEVHPKVVDLCRKRTVSALLSDGDEFGSFKLEPVFVLYFFRIYIGHSRRTNAKHKWKEIQDVDRFRKGQGINFKGFSRSFLVEFDGQDGRSHCSFERLYCVVVSKIFMLTPIPLFGEDSHFAYCNILSNGLKPPTSHS